MAPAVALCPLGRLPSLSWEHAPRSDEFAISAFGVGRECVLRIGAALWPRSAGDGG